jgi:hypothetical protein
MPLSFDKPTQIYGGILTKEGIAAANLSRRIVQGLKSDDFFYFYPLMLPSVICGMKEISTAANDQVTAVTIITDSLGNNRIATTTDDTALTWAAPAAVSVGVANTAVLAADATRKRVILTNTTAAATISLGFAANNAVLLSGITLYPNGSTIMLVGKEAQAEIEGIASVAASNLGVQVAT